jgi:hypothetical protein|tara:strand:+ start:412 stop:867 length:456 start_codon:yes stop_codon:yes gene_type:complete
MIEGILGPLAPFLQRVNNSKFFAGFVMILLNIGSRYVKIDISKSQEQYLRKSLGRHILIFAITWLGTKDILIALAITGIFNVLIDYLLNEDSKLCIIPKKYREYENILDLDGDGVVTEEEINKATAILKKAKEKNRKKDMLRNMSNFQVNL